MERRRGGLEDVVIITTILQVYLGYLETKEAAAAAGTLDRVGLAFNVIITELFSPFMPIDSRPPQHLDKE